jgi:signal transduction histidine kinase
VYSRWIQSSLVESYLPFLAVLVIAMLASVMAAVAGARREAELARLRADFVSSVSHELRMPLAQILMSGETLRFGRIRSQAEHDAEADSIVREALHLTGLVDNALFFSRIEHHNVSLNPRAVDLHRVVSEAVHGMWLLAEGADVTVTNAVPLYLDAVVDPHAFRQVLVNLLDNAIKYGPPGQEILVGAAASPHDDGRLEVWVDDEGPGVPLAEASSIFEPFIRLERDRNVGIAGSGLGLAVVRHIVEQHGGRIRVEPSGRGTGSRFVVEVSAARRPSPETAALNGKGRGRGRARENSKAESKE